MSSKLVCLSSALLVSASLGVAACGGTSGPAQAGSSHSVPLQAPAHGCGSLRLSAARDADGVVAKLPADHREAYRGYPTPVTKSHWAGWKPSGNGPYKIGVVWGPSTAGFQTDLSNAILQPLKASPLVKSVAFRATGADVNIPLELEAFNSLVNQKVDLIIVEPLVTGAFIEAVKRAGAASIPVVTVQNGIDSPYALNVGPNLTLASAEAAARLFQIIGGKGNVLKVGGIPSVPAQLEADAGQKAALAACPDIKVAGEVFGNFADAVAKSQTLRFLATHPQRIDGVLQAGTMTGGIMGAFQQAGRPMPVVADIGPMKASLGYWTTHQDSYHGVGTAFGSKALGGAAVSVALRLLKGESPLVSSMVARVPLLTEANLGQWADKSWALTTPGQAEGPPGIWFNEKYINAFFAQGTPPQGS